MPTPYDKLYKRELSEEELAEARHNLMGLFRELIAADQEKRSKEGENHLEQDDT